MAVRRMTTRTKKWVTWTLIGVGSVVVAIVGFLIIYQLTHKAPQSADKDFSELNEDATGPAADFSLPGTWQTITPTAEEEADFYAGYRVDEVLFGQNVTATGRTHDVQGNLTFDGTKLTAADITVDLTTVESDESRRDNQFSGRIMRVSEWPTATFVLTTPVDVPEIAGQSAPVTITATGDLTLRDTTKSVTVELQAFATGHRIVVTGEIAIVFDEWGIPEPSFGPATVEDHGSIELLITFEQAV